LEAVVRHALEKEISARTPSVEVFVQELKAAVAAGPAVVSSGQPIAPVVDETMYAPAGKTGATSQAPGGVSSSSVVEGSIDTSALSAEEQAKLAAAREAHEVEQRHKERVAREELAREEEARRKSAEEKEGKLKEQEERARKEREEREERERQQREQMERVERQAKELEERLARLATSMVPPAAGASMIDPEATQVHQGAGADAVGDNSLTGGGATVYERAASSMSVPIPATTIPPQPKSNSMLLIGGVVVLVLLIGGGIGAYFLLRSKTTPPVGPGGDPTPAVSPGVGEKIKADMVEIPGGTFQMGRNDGPLNEIPAHSVVVSSFFMDKTEITNAEYEQFVQETNRRSWPEDWKGPKAPYGRDLYPVASVSFDDANDFAKWRSNRDGVQYRLPTEEEWEYAARNGDKNDLYPWGNKWKDNSAVLLQTDAEPVGSRPEGKNRWGVQDLIGNVWEWTSSKLSVYPGSDGEIPPAFRARVIFRGGSYISNPADKVNQVTSCLRSAGEPSFKTGNLGFRLVRSAP
jgi:formylglycine-generating enzyme required for sulfatase activity